MATPLSAGADTTAIHPVDPFNAISGRNKRSLAAVAFYRGTDSIFFMAICSAHAHDAGQSHIMIGVLFPSKYEAVDFLAHLNNAMTYRMERGFPCTIGELGRRTVSVGIIGMGRPHAARRAELFIDKVEPKMLYLAGFAGGLNPALSRGSVYVTCDAATIHTAEELVGTPERKREVYGQSGCDIVDMESADIAALAAAKGLPLTIVRAVSDTADDGVPAALLAKGYNQQRGKETPLRMAAHLATHWGDIGRLRRFLAPLPQVRKELATALVEQINGK